MLTDPYGEAVCYFKQRQTNKSMVTMMQTDPYGEAVYMV